MSLRYMPELATSMWPRINEDTQHKRSGAYKLAGAVSRLGSPGPYRVRLFDKASNLCIRGTWSDAQGHYEFRHLANVLYFVVAFDHRDNPVNAAISDYVTPEPM